MKKVAVTGGLASGKTTVCEFLKQSGAFVISADEIVHKLLAPETETGKKVLALLSDAGIKEGSIDRKSIARLVFSDPEQLSQLETIIHPAVLEELERSANKAKEANTPLFVAEIPLLFELGWEKHFDITIDVSTDEEIAEGRYAKDDYAQRMRRQMPLKEKAKRATFTITNNSSIQELKNQIDQVMLQIRRV